MTTTSQFGIQAHAQIQTIDGRTFELQPEHLLCEDCWNLADTAYAHASYFGDAGARWVSVEGEVHEMHVTKRGEV